MRTVGAYIGAVVAFALLAVIWPQEEFLHHNDWLDLVPWGLSIVIWAIASYGWVTTTTRGRWLCAAGSLIGLIAILAIDLAIGITLSCERGVCL